MPLGPSGTECGWLDAAPAVSRPKRIVDSDLVRDVPDTFVQPVNSTSSELIGVLVAAESLAVANAVTTWPSSRRM